MKLTDYTTDELKRLTTLTFSGCKPGEFAHVPESFGITPQLRLTNGQITDAHGSIGIPGGYAPVRRVRSFTDATELDPPQAEMLAELRRREQPPISNATHAGRRVRLMRSITSGRGTYIPPQQGRILNERAHLVTMQGLAILNDRLPTLEFTVALDEGVLLSVGKGDADKFVLLD